MKRNKLFCAQRRVLQGMLIGGVALSTGVQAQDAATEPQADTAPANKRVADLDGMVVTAQRREERLQDVPISISALSAEELAIRGVTDIRSLSANVPSLFIPTPNGPTGTTQISIRGASGLLQTAGSSPAVSVYLDGIYMPRPEAGMFALDDVERIEVLRGPQGALYGRNSTGGAINIITRDPGDEMRGGYDISYGNYNALNVKGSVSGPLGGGFSGGVSFGHTNRDGYFYNETTGNDLEGIHSYTIRGKLRYASPENKFSAVLSADQAKVRTSGVYQALYSGGYQLPPVAPPAYIGLGDPYVVQMDKVSEDFMRMDTDSKGVGLTMNWDLGEHVALTWINGVRNFTNYSSTDPDASAGTTGPAVGLLSKSFTEFDSFNSELRAVLTYDRFRATVGTNYYKEDQDFGSNSGFAAVPPPPFSALGSVITAPYNNPAATSNLKAMAVFGQAEFDVTDRFTVVGGLRWNQEERDYVVDYSGVVLGAVGGVPIVGPKFSGRLKDTVWIPSAGINFKLSSDVLLYAKYSSGYLSPGFNANAGSRSASTTDITFGAENLDTYELGIKSQFLDRKLTFNAAAFHTIYEDIQVRVSTGPGQGQVLNAAQATIDGVETSLSYATGTGLVVSGHLTWLDARYDKFCENVAGMANTATDRGYYVGTDPMCTNPGAIEVDRSGHRLNQAPEWQGGVSVGYYTSVGDRSSMNFNVSYNASSSFKYGLPNNSDFESGRTESLDARVGYTFGSGVEVYAFGKNLTDHWHADMIGGSFLPLVFKHISDPRTYGVGVRYQF
ncbi:MAG: TonB-dependent receptor [Pseudoxanthomonas sp.]